MGTIRRDFPSWRLVISLDKTSPVRLGTLVHCLEKFRTLLKFDNILCFHLADIFHEKFLSQHWLQLLAIIFCRQTKISFFEKHPYTCEKPVLVNEKLSVVHEWSCTNIGDRPLRRTAWQDRRAIFAHLIRQRSDWHYEKWLITQPTIRPNHLSWITYDSTGILQAPGTVVLCCPADLIFY